MSKNSFYLREQYRIKAKSMMTVNFATAENYFHIVNMGSGTLYFAAARTPSADSYDLKIPAGGAKMHTEPNPRMEVYIYNDSAQDADFSLLHFYADFDPLVLAMASGVGAAGGTSGGSGGAETFDGIIRGWETSLPSGNNTIGNVHLNTNGQLTQIIDALKGATPAGTNKIGSVDIANSNQLASILNHITKPTYGLFNSGNSTGTGVTVAATSGRKITCITFLANDGEGDLSVTVGDATFTLKAGEVLDNFQVYVDQVKVLGNGIPYRMAYNEKEV